MKVKTQKMHHILETTTPPSFRNDSHRAALRNRLMSEYAAVRLQEGTHGQRQIPILTRRLSYVAACAVVAVLLIPLGTWLLTPKSVWAHVLEAIAEVDTVVITVTSTESGELGPGKIYARLPDQFATFSATQKTWLNRSALCVYNLKSGEVQKATVRIQGTVGLAKRLLSYSQLSGKGYNEERDLGVVEVESRKIKVIEMIDQSDPTQKQVLHLDPETMLPTKHVIYKRPDATKEWRCVFQASFECNVPIDDAVFLPDYPETCVVKDLGEIKMDGPVEDKGDGAHRLQDRCAIAYVGKKYIAVHDVWLNPAGWVVVKFKTNLEDIGGPYEFTEDPANQKRWDVDQGELHELLYWQKLAGDNGLTYTSVPALHPEISLIRFYRPMVSDNSRAVLPKEFALRAIANTATRKFGETMQDFFDWRDNPERWQRFELKFRAPKPSPEPPEGFDDDDLSFVNEAKRIMRHMR